MIAGTVCMADAQEKITFGVRAGLNVNSLSTPGDSGLKSRIGYHVGAVMDWNAAKNLYVQPGLYFTTRGAKSSEEGMEMKINMNYLQIPISVSYRFPVSQQVKIDVNAGPYIALGLGGKAKFSGDYDYDDYSYDYDYDYDDDDYYGGGDEMKMFGSEGLCKRFDAGLRFGAGVHIKQFSVGLCYDLGLMNIARESEGKLKNGSFQISLGYNF